jgi:hypothetical protein
MSPRGAQILAGALAALLVVVIGATVFILLGQPSAPVGPTPTPTGSGVPIGTPSFTPSPLFTPSPSASSSPTLAPTASPLPTAVPTASPSPTASAEPTASPSPSPSPTATPSPSPSPTIVPTSPQRQFTILDVGLDGTSGEFPIERFVTFTVDGPSLLRARLSDVPSGGRVRLCMFREQVNDERDCARLRNGTLERTVTDTGSSEWTVSMLGVDSAPRVTLTVDFNAQQPAVELGSFRYNGTTDNAYNGFLVQVPAAANGQLQLAADFEGGSFTYHLVVEPTGGGAAIVDQTGGPSGSIDASESVSGGQNYRVSVRSPDAAVNSPTSVFIHAVLSWP